MRQEIMTEKYDPSVFQPATKQHLMPIAGSYTRNSLSEFNKVEISTSANFCTPSILSNPIFIPGYLKQNIGKTVRLELLIGAGMMSRVGKLIEVGANFVVIQTKENETMLCDMCMVKLVTIVNNSCCNKCYDVNL